jgi:hypothetical protein
MGDFIGYLSKIGENNFERKQTGIKRDGIDPENSSN